MIDRDEHICAIVPAYNEELNIRCVLEDISQHHPDIKIVVVNDCSDDNTEGVVRELDQTILNLPINLGIGGAVQTGMKYAMANDFDIAIQFDGDGQHLAAEIDSIIKPVVNGTHDVVIGSRFLKPSGYSAGHFRSIGIGVFRMLNSLLLGSTITDNTSGFRAYGRKAISFLAQFYPQDYPEAEAVIELFRNGFRIGEVAVTMRERSGGESSIGVMNSVYYMIKVVMANLIAFSRRPVKQETEQNG